MSGVVLRAVARACQRLPQVSSNLRAAGCVVVSIVSVMGGYRTGKSFLLDLMMRYLRRRVVRQDSAVAQGVFGAARSSCRGLLRGGSGAARGGGGAAVSDARGCATPAVGGGQRGRNLRPRPDQIGAGNCRHANASQGAYNARACRHNAPTQGLRRGHHESGAGPSITKAAFGETVCAPAALGLARAWRRAFVLAASRRPMIAERERESTIIRKLPHSCPPSAPKSDLARLLSRRAPSSYPKIAP